jgi:membrane-associated HD superfamily phosphohydrolase
MDVADQIIKVIDKLAEKFGIVVDTSKPLLEDLSKKIIEYTIIENSIILIGFIIIIALILFGAFKGIKYLIKEDMSGLVVLVILTTILALIMPIEKTIESTNKIITAKVFPEQVVIEYVSDQYKKIK